MERETGLRRFFVATCHNVVEMKAWGGRGGGGAHRKVRRSAQLSKK